MLIRTWQRLTNLGIEVSSSFEETKKTKLINVCYWTILPAFFLFSMLNFLEGDYTLGFTHLLIAIVSGIFLAVNYLHRLEWTRVVLLILTTLLFTFSVLQHHTGTEYFLLVNMVISALLFNDSKHIFPLTLLNAVLFVFLIYHVHYSPSANSIPQVPVYRILIRVVIALSLFMLAIQYFVREYAKGRREIVASNNRLAQQQERLVIQKRELEQKNDQLEILNETKEKLFTVVAHDMRSPIAALKTSLDLFNSNMITTDEFKMLTTQLSVQVNQLWDNLDNLLQWCHSQMAGIITHPTTVKLDKAFAEVTELLHSGIQHKKLQLETGFPNETSVFADLNHVKIILRNLLSNAIKYSNVGGHIKVACHHTEEETCITIRDEGKGMTPEQVDNLFTYNKKPVMGTMNEKGSGLGLMLCAEFAQKNRGRISASSVAGEGSVFTLCLPSARIANSS